MVAGGFCRLGQAIPLDVSHITSATLNKGLQKTILQEAPAVISSLVSPSLSTDHGYAESKQLWSGENCLTSDVRH